MKMATLLSDWFHLDKIVLLSSFVYMIETTQAVHFSNMKLVDPNQIVSWVRKKKKNNESEVSIQIQIWEI